MIQWETEEEEEEEKEEKRFGQGARKPIANTFHYLTVYEKALNASFVFNWTATCIFSFQLKEGK